jgi:hypothetical protein
MWVRIRKETEKVVLDCLKISEISRLGSFKIDFDYFWLILIIFDYFWLFLIIFDYFWLFLIIFDYFWLLLIIFWLFLIIFCHFFNYFPRNGNVSKKFRKCMKFHLFRQIFIKFYFWLFLIIFDYFWLFLIIVDYFWLFLIIFDYCWLFLIIVDYLLAQSKSFLVLRNIMKGKEIWPEFQVVGP